RRYRVDRQGDDLDAALGKLVFQFGGQAQLGGANRGEVRRVGTQNAPAVTQPFVEANATFTGILLEVGGNIAQQDSRVLRFYAGADEKKCRLWEQFALRLTSLKRIYSNFVLRLRN